jgi:hypothetical protein
MRPHSLAALLLTFSLVLSWVHPGNTSEKIQIGIIQYNVKGGQGGWTAFNGILKQQIRLITDQINASAVDFLALEQAGEQPGLPGPIISDIRL